jgi:membrane-bound lytic murein transglycosylase D
MKGYAAKSWGYILAGLLLGLSVGIFYSFSTTDSNNKFEQGERIMYKWQPFPMPKKIDFAGERTPLERQEVYEYFDRELQNNYYRHGSFIYTLKLSGRVFPVIEKILKAEGIPDDFKYLCVAESNLQNLVSPAGAEGYWQFLKATAIQYGLEVTSEVDERYHLEKSTIAATKYLKDAYKKAGTWTGAAAGYNCGTGGYNARVTYQGSDNYYDLMLPEETNRYIFRILAFKHLMGNANEIGFVIPKNEMFKPYKTTTITVNSSIADLAVFARNQGSSYKLVKMLNPWLKDKKLTVKPGKSYDILIQKI